MPRTPLTDSVEYHLACDDYNNIDLHALEVNSDLIAFAARRSRTRPHQDAA